MKALDSLNSLKTELEDIKSKYQAAASSAFTDAIKEVFETHPQIKSLYWVQYTPFFNDGDECVFSVGDLCAADVLDLDEVSDDENYFNGEPAWKYPDEFDETLSTLARWMGKNDYILKDVYGDHVRVHLTYDFGKVWANVEEYDHD